MKAKGFTLLEMIIVIMVLSVLFLLTVPNIQKVIGIIENKGCDALIKVVDSAILEYKLEYGTTPNSITDLIYEGLLSEEQSQCANGQRIEIYNGQASTQ